MGWYGGYGDWAPYVSVAEKIAKGNAAAKKRAKREGREPAPIKLQGKKIANTFWGKQWCANLERYGSIANRLPRGSRYVRNGSVADLVIETGRIRAIVGGSEAYEIEINIQPLSPKFWRAIAGDCASQIDSLLDLLQGRFSEAVMTRLTRENDGLLPHAKEIKSSCSCPDYADVCKHIAATFYGVGARLDHAPELLFKLRNVDHLELLGQAASRANLDQALGAEPGNALQEQDLSELFGIELESSKPKRNAQTKKAELKSKIASPTRLQASRKTAVAKAKPAKKAAVVSSKAASAVPVSRETAKSRANAKMIDILKSAKKLAKKAPKKKSAKQAAPKKRGKVAAKSKTKTSKK